MSFKPHEEFQLVSATWLFILCRILRIITSFASFINNFDTVCLLALAAVNLVLTILAAVLEN